MIPSPRHHKRIGFTLVEMLVVVLLVGILLTMVMLKANGPAGADRTAANQVAAMLDRARARAIASGGLAAFVVVSGKSPEHAWRRVAVFDVVENQTPASQAPTAEEDVHRYQVKARADGRVEPVAPWENLPGNVILFGKIAGKAQIESFVDAPESLIVPLALGGSEVESKAIIFNAEGGVAYPDSKPLRVARLGRADGFGDETELLAAVRDSAVNQPSVTIERFTGRIHIDQ